MFEKSSQKYVIIVAGGKGLRMQSEIPKQFLLLAKKPVLMHSIDAFYSFDSTIQCIVVLPEQQIDYWKQLCTTYSYATPHIIVKGGKERFYSVLSGLEHIQTDGFVAIHDGVRPLVSKLLISKGFEIAQMYSSAIPVIDSIDSLRYVNSKTNYPLDRTTIKRVQTPQIFSVEKLKKAYQQAFDISFTDDASVWEKAGNIVSCFSGNETNLKVTTPYDLAYAEILLKLQL